MRFDWPSLHRIRGRSLAQGDLRPLISAMRARPSRWRAEFRLPPKKAPYTAVATNLENGPCMTIIRMRVDYQPHNGRLYVMLSRHLTASVLEALADTPAVLVNGARQTGKSTLVQSEELAGQARQYLTFDDPGVLAAAKRDPNGFIAGLNTPVTLDEVQHVPELFPVIKAACAQLGQHQHHHLGAIQPGLRLHRRTGCWFPTTIPATPRITMAACACKRYS